LHAHLGGLVKELKGKSLAIGGMADHIHLLIELQPIFPVSEALRFIKTNSSKWATEKFNKPFEWEKGYGAFSVSRSNVDAVAKYINSQEEHHRKFDFKTEFVSMLRKSGVDFDEKLLWK
jgi:REP element-mobilizing transposase RayT